MEMRITNKLSYAFNCLTRISFLTIMMYNAGVDAKTSSALRCYSLMKRLLDTFHRFFPRMQSRDSVYSLLLVHIRRWEVGGKEGSVLACGAARLLFILTSNYLGIC